MDSGCRGELRGRAWPGLPMVPGILEDKAGSLIVLAMFGLDTASAFSSSAAFLTLVVA